MTRPLSPALRRVVDGVERTLDRFPAAWTQDSAIAFSGGKDSIALAAALDASGRGVILRAIDMGYSARWGERLRGIAEALRLPLEIVSVRQLVRDADTDPEIRRDLAIRRAFLDGSGANAASVTPCTNCYNCKILSLVDAAGSDRPAILFGHHATDTISSFLKSALMHLDRWEEDHTRFDRDNFRALALRYGRDLRDGARSASAKFLRLLADGKAQTSEPAVERRPLHGRSYSIGRPLFLVNEADTVALAGELAFHTESSGCGHTAAAVTRTPREIVHHELLPIAAATAAGRWALRELLEAIAASLASDGTAVTDARNSRHLLLGSDYKGDGAMLAEKL